jgi:hypothetical protein
MLSDMEIVDFLDGMLSSNHSIYVKRLSANDTGATGSHQAGPYLPKEVAFALSPELRVAGTNPDQIFTTCVASHGVSRETRLIWYNQKSRDECRITRWAHEGRTNSVIAPNQTGAIALFAFTTSPTKGILHSWAWICEDIDEEDVVETRIGDVEPGTAIFRHQGKTSILTGASPTSPCMLPMSRLPPEWATTFPDTSVLVGKTIDLLRGSGASLDERLVRRRNCEFQLFQTIEAAHVLPKIRAGFTSVDAFVDLANSVTNRRKSRSGRSLELHLERIFTETSVLHSHGAKSEGKSTPDFLFPSAANYANPTYDARKLRMLGAKTTCKDRWRQVLKEANRIPIKHIATLQEGVSKDQFVEMKKAGVVLVVPKPLHRKYPPEVRAELRSLSEFVRELQDLQR